MGQGPGRRSRTRPWPVFHAIFFHPHFSSRGSPIRNKKLRRRIWAEFALTAGVWICLLAAVAWWGAWKYFLWMYLAPAYLAANMQSWRKYIEHVGLTGSTVNSSTRSIVSGGLARPVRRLHPAPRALSWRASSARRPAARRIASARCGTRAAKSRRSIPLSELSARVDGPFPQPSRSPRGSSVAQGHTAVSGGSIPSSRATRGEH